MDQHIALKWHASSIHHITKICKCPNFIGLIQETVFAELKVLFSLFDMFMEIQ